MASMRIVVAGGGAVGLCCAVRLAEAGFAVTLADPGGANASSVAAGMLAPAFETAMDGEAGDFMLLAAARDAWVDFAAGAGVRLDRSGALGVGDAAALARWADVMEAAGAAAEMLTESEACSLQPALREVGPALFTMEDWRLEPAQALQALQDHAEALGVQSMAARVEDFDAGVTTLSDGERLPADLLVAATGFAKDLARELRVLRPIKGQIARAEGGPADGPAIRAAGLYVVPSPQGAVIGATMESGRDDTAVEEAVIHTMAGRARALVDGVGETEGAAGVRAATPDGWPLVGPSLQAEGVILAAGARRNGWLLAPLIAEQVVRAARGEGSEPRAARFDPGRFA